MIIQNRNQTLKAFRRDSILYGGARVVLQYRRGSVRLHRLKR